MTEDLIDTIVNEAVTPAEEPKAETPEVETPAEDSPKSEAKPDTEVEARGDVEIEEDELEDSEEPEPEGNDKTEPKEEFSPKARNALKRVKQEAKKRRLENNELKRQIEELKATIASKTEVGEAPKEGDYDSYDDYLKAEMDFRVKDGINNSLDAQNKQKLASLEERQKAAYVNEREHHMAEKYIEVAGEIKDYNQVLQNAAPILDSLPPQITEIAYEIDNAPLAFYNLAKSGQLAQLANMPREIAVATIIQAQNTKPFVETPKPKISSAPAPVRGVSGTGKQSKQLVQMDAGELLNLINT